MNGSIRIQGYYSPCKVEPAALPEGRAPVRDDVLGQNPSHLFVQPADADVVAVEGHEERHAHVEQEERTEDPPAVGVEGQGFEQDEDAQEHENRIGVGGRIRVPELKRKSQVCNRANLATIG